MRHSVTILLLLASQLVWSQLTIKPIVLQKKNTKTSKAIAPASLPFWDDFSASTSSVDSMRIWGNDSTSQWDLENSKDVFVNATLAINPPTYNVVTFDGLDGDGGFRSDTLGIADQLQSSVIDLSSYEQSDSIYISFFWQSGGNVEKPDDRDSIRLQFYNPNSNNSDKWITVWAEKGNDEIQKTDSTFTQEFILVKKDFLTDEFKFRFQSFGDLTGPFDAWHLDWIYLNNNRTVAEKREGYFDKSVSGQLSSPFTPFTSLPTSQLTNDNKYIKNQSISISSLFADTIQINVNYILKIVNNDELIINDNRGVDPLSSIDPFREITLGIGDPNAEDIFLDELDFNSLKTFDSAIIRSTVFLRDDNSDFILSENIDLRINDTIRQDYLLHNYYAYDDGTAEYAAGTNVSNGQVAVKFWLEEQDTLTHVAFHFPNISPPAEGKSLTLSIFKTLNDNASPIRSQQINVKTDSVINGFTYYELIRPLILSDTFYVAYQQSSSEYIGVGFDRSNGDASDYIFENEGEGWKKNNTLTGALMIRPIFKRVVDFSLGYDQPKKLTIFPNPSDGILSINGNYSSIEVLNVSGKVLFTEQAKSQHDFSNLARGLYLLKVHQADGDRTYKIIKK